MKKVTKLLVIAIAVLSFNTVAAQQDTKPQNAKVKMHPIPKETPEQRAQAYTDTLKNLLSLSADQYQKVLAINTDFITKRDALRKTMAADTTGQGKGQIKMLKQDRNSQIKAILTTDQQAKWTIWKKEKIKTYKPSKEGKMDNDLDGM